MNECEISQAQGQGARRGLLGRMAGRAVSPQSRLSSPRRVGRRDSRRAPRRATSLRSRLSCGRAGVNDNARNAKKSRATSGTVCSQLTRPRRSIHTDASDDAHMSLSVRSSPHASTLLTLHAKLCARSPSLAFASARLAFWAFPPPPLLAAPYPNPCVPAQPLAAHTVRGQAPRRFPAAAPTVHDNPHLTCWPVEREITRVAAAPRRRRPPSPPRPPW